MWDTIWLYTTMILFLWVSFIQKENDFLSLFSPRKKTRMHLYTCICVSYVKHFCCILLVTTIIAMRKISMNEKEKEEERKSTKKNEKKLSACVSVSSFFLSTSFFFRQSYSSRSSKGKEETIRKPTGFSLAFLSPHWFLVFVLERQKNIFFLLHQTTKQKFFLL